jgi:Flp pilus assembly protein TadB
MTEEQQSPTGKPMVPATPKDVVHIRVGSFLLVFCVAVGLIAALAGVWWLTVVVIAVALVVVLDVVLAVRRQRRLGGGPESRE